MTTLITRPATTVDPPAAPAAAEQWRGASIPVQIWVLTGRSMRALRNPGFVVPRLLYPVIMLTLFSQIFQSIDQTPGFPAGSKYIDYLLPAILMATALGGGARSGTALTTEMRNGIIGRFKSMPVHTGSILFARSVADTVQTIIDLIVTVVLGVVVFGFSPAGGVLGCLGMLAVAAVVGWSIGWVFLFLGAWLRKVEALEPITGIITTLPLFASNAFVPTENLPGWLSTVAAGNPLSGAIDSARALAFGTADASSVLVSIVGCVAVAVLAAPFAITLFRRR